MSGIFTGYFVVGAGNNKYGNLVVDLAANRRGIIAFLAVDGLAETFEVLRHAVLANRVCCFRHASSCDDSICDDLIDITGALGTATAALEITTVIKAMEKDFIVKSP